jgi:hypothetical protein
MANWLVSYRHPRVFTTPSGQLEEVLDFLATEPLCLTDDQQRSVVRGGQGLAGGHQCSSKWCAFLL